MRTFFFEQSHKMKDQETILSILEQQNQDWNKGDLDNFMKGYWESDALKFIGSNGIKYGYKETLDRYKKNYPNRSSMGKLEFEIFDLKIYNEQDAFVLGKWTLFRESDRPSGYFTLIWKKINNQWKIIVDHSA